MKEEKFRVLEVFLLDLVMALLGWSVIKLICKVDNSVTDSFIYTLFDVILIVVIIIEAIIFLLRKKIYFSK